MRSFVSVLGALLLGAAVPLCAQEPRTPATGPVIEGMASNYTLQLRYMAAAPVSIRSDLDYGLLLGDPHNAIASAAWLLDSEWEHVIPRLSFEVGPKAYMALLANENRGVLSLAVGGDARLELIPRIGLAFVGSAFYGPSILMFGAANNLYDITAGVQVRFARRLLALGGYRWFRYSLQHTGDDTVQNNVFVGLRYDLGRGPP